MRGRTPPQVCSGQAGEATSTTQHFGLDSAEENRRSPPRTQLRSSKCEVGLPHPRGRTRMISARRVSAGPTPNWLSPGDERTRMFSRTCVHLEPLLSRLAHLPWAAASDGSRCPARRHPGPTRSTSRPASSPKQAGGAGIPRRRASVDATWKFRAWLLVLAKIILGARSRIGQENKLCPQSLLFHTRAHPIYRTDLPSGRLANASGRLQS